MITILKISDNAFRVSGTAKVCVEMYKQVVVDGEVFSKRWLEDKDLDLDKNFEGLEDGYGNWVRYELCEMQFAGIDPIIFWDYNFSYSSAASSAFFNYSENRVVNAYFNLHDQFNVFGDDIKIYTGKAEYKYPITANKDFLETGKFNVLLFSYGFNNHLYAQMKPERFLQLDFSKVSYETKYAYKELIPELETVKARFNEAQLFEISHRLFNLLIQFNERDQQRLIPSFMWANGLTH